MVWHLFRVTAPLAIPLRGPKGEPRSALARDDPAGTARSAHGAHQREGNDT